MHTDSCNNLREKKKNKIIFLMVTSITPTICKGCSAWHILEPFLTPYSFLKYKETVFFLLFPYISWSISYACKLLLNMLLRFIRLVLMTTPHVNGTCRQYDNEFLLNLTLILSYASFDQDFSY